MYGYIYLTTNLVNGKKYIGKHKSETFDPSYYGSGKILLQSLYKTDSKGRKVKCSENFNCEVLHWCKTKEELNYWEAFYIKEHCAVESEEYYNLTDGGRGDSVKGLIYITNGVVNKKIHPEELDYWVAQGFYKGGPKPSLEFIEKRRQSNTGKKRSAEACANISNSLKGKTLSEETREKQSQAKLGKAPPNKGKVYVFKDDQYYQIPKEQLNEYLAEGYIKQGPKHKDPEGSKINYSNARKNKAIVNDGIRYYYIDKHQLQEYLDKGYKLNKPKQNK